MTIAKCSEGTTILKALVGSRAHGINRPDSDWDWRGIYIQPTREILSMGHQARSIQWIEGKEDFTNYEIGHFLMLATTANPSVLELLVSPVIESPSPVGVVWSTKLLSLFPLLFDPQDAFNAFTGYSLNQRKKLLDDKDGRKWKYALAYIRTLWCLVDLLEHGKFTLAVPDENRRATLIAIRDGQVTAGEIINLANAIQETAKEALALSVNRKDPEKVNNFLLEVRKAFW